MSAATFESISPGRTANPVRQILISMKFSLVLFYISLPQAGFLTK